MIFEARGTLKQKEYLFCLDRLYNTASVTGTRFCKGLVFPELSGTIRLTLIHLQINPLINIIWPHHKQTKESLRRSLGSRPTQEFSLLCPFPLKPTPLSVRSAT